MEEMNKLLMQEFHSFLFWLTPRLYSNTYKFFLTLPAAGGCTSFCCGASWGLEGTVAAETDCIGGSSTFFRDGILSGGGGTQATAGCSRGGSAAFWYASI